ncbi:MAG: glycosyltransferase family 9 protein [Candidatus Omnitrophota bacterium]
MKVDKEKINRALVITLSNVGDAVLTLPVIDALAAGLPRARIDVLAAPGVMDIFEHDPRVSKVFMYDKRSGIFEKYRLIKKLRGMGYDIVVDLKNTFIPILLLSRYRTAVFRPVKGIMHKRDEHLLRISGIGFNTDSACFVFPILEDEKDNADRLLGEAFGGREFVIVNPGAKSCLKRWPADRYAGLCDRIIGELHLGVAIVGSNQGRANPNSDRFVADNVIKAMKEKAGDFVGKTGMGELAHLMKNAKAVVTNDSGPLHVASAVNTPTVAVFGPTDEAKYGPLADSSVVVRENIECAPCGKARCVRAHECLNNISVDRVFSPLKKICGF